HTGKIREIDVLARRLWRRRRKEHSQSISVELVVEGKSIRDFHLVFGPYGEHVPLEISHHEWIGDHEKRLASTLNARGAATADVEEVIRRFKSSCFTTDDRMRVHGLFVDPPFPAFRASTFRETNV